jgi:hypothetical protein
VKGRVEVTDLKGRFSELIVALIKLAALQVRLEQSQPKRRGPSTARSFSQLALGIGQCNRRNHRREIDAAARALELKLIAGHELGFQCLLRSNFPSDVIRDMARAALEAARTG